MIESYFTDTVTIRHVTLDKYKNATTTDANYPARVEATSRAIRGANGESIQCTYEIWLSPTADVQQSDRVVFDMPQTGEPDREWAILSVFNANGFGPSHLEVLV